MNKINKIILLVMLVVSIMFPQFATAQSDVPLMIVRYNQPRIYYDKQLYNVAQKAINIKPEVIFSVVSFVPKAGEYGDQDTIDEAAEKQTAIFVAKLKQMGIPLKQINISKEYAPDARHHEIYLYVD
jgi:hypothetical protein